MKSLITVAAALLLAMPSATAPAAAPSAARIVTEAGWTRAMPPGATVTAGYLRIRNTGTAADRLLSASSPAAKRVELHETSMVDGDMQMRQIEQLELAPGTVVNLAPGGMHLMLIGLVKPLKVDELVTVNLRFEHAGRIKARLRVRPIGATGP
jgi:periplasmic copper chaperone A